MEKAVAVTTYRGGHGGIGGGGRHVGVETGIVQAACSHALKAALSADGGGGGGGGGGRVNEPARFVKAVRGRRPVVVAAVMQDHTAAVVEVVAKAVLEVGELV
jgi:hypothetical protein